MHTMLFMVATISKKIVTPENIYTSVEDFLDDLEEIKKHSNSKLPLTLSEEEKRSYAFRLYALRKEYSSNDEITEMIDGD